MVEWKEEHPLERQYGASPFAQPQVGKLFPDFHKRTSLIYHCKQSCGLLGKEFATHSLNSIPVNMVAAHTVLCSDIWGSNFFTWSNFRGGEGGGLCPESS